MNEDGRMARLKDLQKFSIKHKIKIASIEDLIAYRLRNEKLIVKSHIKKTKINDCELSIYENKLNNLKNYVIKSVKNLQKLRFMGKSLRKKSGTEM